eukprot:UN04753
MESSSIYTSLISLLTKNRKTVYRESGESFYVPINLQKIIITIPKMNGVKQKMLNTALPFISMLKELDWRVSIRRREKYDELMLFCVPEFFDITNVANWNPIKK